MIYILEIFKIDHQSKITYVINSRPEERCTKDGDVVCHDCFYTGTCTADSSDPTIFTINSTSLVECDPNEVNAFRYSNYHT